MVPLLDGNSEIGAQVRSNICYLNCIKHLIRSRAVTNRTPTPRKDQFSFMHAQHVLRYHIIWVPWFTRGYVILPALSLWNLLICLIKVCKLSTNYFLFEAKSVIKDILLKKRTDKLNIIDISELYYTFGQ